MLFSEHVNAVAALAYEARGSDDPWQGVHDFLGAVLSMQARDRGLSQILRGGGLGASHAHEARLRVTPVVDDDATWRRALSIVLAGLRADGLAGTTPDGSTVDRLQGR